MLVNFVLSKRVSGTSREDAELDIVQLTEGDSFEIKNPKRLIASHIYMCLESYIDSRYNAAFIRTLLDKNGVYRLMTVTDNEDTQVYVIVNNQKYQYDIYGSYSVRHVFYIKQYDDREVVYLAAEHLINPNPDCDLIQRCYRPYFESAGAANRYCNRLMTDYKTKCGSASSGYRVTVEKRSVIDESVWYKKNIKAAKYIVKYDLDQEDYRYIADIDELVDTVMADSYDNLSVVERAAVDHHIYNAMRDFISSDTCYTIDETIDFVQGDDLKAMVDVSIILAFAQAKDEETFNKIYEALGPNAYRVGCLTDDIYNDHPDKGYILITKDGQLGWFADSDVFLNTWDGIKSCPFYGKLQPNENDTLYCLREFHPEMFVDRFPELMELDKYRRMYQNFLSDQRKEHPEFRFTTQGGREMACGDWYPRGVLDPKVYKNTMFPRNYGTHEFSDDECKRLLSGEELVIENYLTKMDSLITIRGKLKDIATDFDDGPVICFTRTDIGSKMRTTLNAEFGIQEPGLPNPDC